MYVRAAVVVVDTDKAKTNSSRQGQVQPPTFRLSKTAFCAFSHPNRRCPAYGKRCKACNHLKHDARSEICERNSVNTFCTEDEECYLQSETDGSKDILWKVTIKLNGRDKTFKTDTGADVSVMSALVFNKLKSRPNLEKTNSTAQPWWSSELHRKDRSQCQS